MNKKNRKCEAQKRRVERKKILLELKEEIETIENEIKYSQLKHLKRSGIKNLKIGARAIQLVAPYIVTAGITAGIFSFFHATPFYYGDERKCCAHMKTKLNSEGDISCKKQYESFKDSTSQLYYYTKWRKEDNGYYSRTVDTYSLDDQSCEEIKKLFDQEKESLEEVLGSPISTVIETKNNLSESEINKEAILKAVIYDINQDDYIIKKETVLDNVLMTFLYLLLTIFAELGPIWFREEYSSFDFASCVFSIQDQYPKTDLDQLKKKLKIRQENYERLLR